MAESDIILVFVRLPKPGYVKTRLGKAIGNRAAAEIYRAFAEDVMDTVKSAGFAFRVHFSPPGGCEAVRAWLGGLSLAPQTGNDLGERMRNALADAFDRGAERAVLIGSDAPDLPRSALTEALESLRRRNAVIGPATDGGYYLIGFSREGFCPEAFSGIEWGTSGVFAKTLEIIRSAGKTVHLLPLHSDVDTREDLDRLKERAKGSSFMESRTMAALSEFPP